MAYNGLGDREIFVEQADQSYLSKEWAQRRGSSKVLKFWSSGVLEFWSSGVLEFWSVII
jgi:hypothetical protein